MNASDFYQQHLDRVSRSFAFCISQLDEPMKPWVGVSYLLCRLLDTIEDSAWSEREVQMRQFQDFDLFLRDKSALVGLSAWKKRFPESLPHGERLLVDDADRIFSDIHAEEMGTARPIIQQLGLSMSLGMQEFAQRQEQGQLRLQGLSEVNRYCYFVAGLVGEALARLLAQVEPRFRLGEERIAEAHHFGLFLQKVNLLKDHLGDEKEGRHLVPDRKVLIGSIPLNAKGAFRFLNHLPQGQKSFRLFCAWSLFLGLGTLAVVERAYRKGRSAKLERKDADEVFRRVSNNIDQPLELEKLFVELGKVINFNLKDWKTEKALESAASVLTQRA